MRCVAGSCATISAALTPGVIAATLPIGVSSMDGDGGFAWADGHVVARKMDDAKRGRTFRWNMVGIMKFPRFSRQARHCEMAATPK
jgi:prepilin-type processing-associated H-X9-DG protein